MTRLVEDPEDRMDHFAVHRAAVRGMRMADQSRGGAAAGVVPQPLQAALGTIEVDWLHESRRR